jgi:DNA topoisomerase-1
LPPRFTATKTGRFKISGKEQADKYLARLENAAYAVRSVKKGTRKKRARAAVHHLDPPAGSVAPPRVSGTAHDENRAGAVRRRGYSGIGTTGLITYMVRTHCAFPKIPEPKATTISPTRSAPNIRRKAPYYRSRANAQDGHEAIRPAIPRLHPSRPNRLTTDQYKLYNLIWQRFIASLMAIACRTP